MRILWHSNSPRSGSGFGVQTALAVSRLQEHHEIAVSCNYGQEGHISEWETPHGVVPLLPKSTSSEFGHDIIGAHADEWQADVIITHYDAWTLDPHTLGRPWCVPAGTLIALSDGRTLPIEKIVRDRLEVELAGWDNGSPAIATITDWHEIDASESGEVLEVTTTSGRILMITAENGIAFAGDSGVEWFPASALIPGDLVYCLGSDHTTETGTEDRRSHGASYDTNRMGIRGGDSRRGRFDLHPARQEARASSTRSWSLHSPTPVVRVEHVGAAAPVALREDGASVQLADQTATPVQKSALSGMYADGSRVPDAECAAWPFSLSDREASTCGDRHRLSGKSDREPEQPLQRTVFAGGAADVVGGQSFEPERVCSVRRLGRPFDRVFDLTTSTANFVAGGFLVHNCPWYPLDCEGVPAAISSRLEHASMRITQTRHAQGATRGLGLDAEYVPAAFDGAVYYPRDPDEWRGPLGLGDRFIVACVASNQWLKGAPSRKAYPQIFEGFAGLLKHDPDALLYVHAQWNGHIDLHRLAERYGITPKNFAHAQPYYLHTGQYTPDALAQIYSAADVLLMPSMGEGFGVPIIEAQACGTPVITGDWTAMSELTRTGLAIPKTFAYKYPVIDYGDMYLVNPSAVTDALLAARGWAYKPAEVSALVQEYEANRVVTEHWQPTLAKLEAQLGASTTRVSAVA